MQTVAEWKSKLPPKTGKRSWKNFSLRHDQITREESYYHPSLWGRATLYPIKDRWTATPLERPCGAVWPRASYLLLFGREEEPFARIFHTPQFTTATALDFERWRRCGGRLHYQYAWYTPWHLVVGCTLRDQQLKLDDVYTPAHQIFGWGDDTLFEVHHELALDITSPQLVRDTGRALAGDTCVRVPYAMALHWGQHPFPEGSDVYLDVEWIRKVEKLDFNTRVLTLSAEELALVRLWKALPKPPSHKQQHILYHEEA